MPYLFILLADILLAGSFIYQKKYQQNCGESIKSGILFNLLTGVFGCVILFLMNGFKVETSAFSIVMATLQTVLVVLYTMISFKILKNSNLSLYTLFLMTGGMILPYIFGLAFLGEPFSLAKTIGLVLITVAIVLSNKVIKVNIKEQIFLLILVFLINGMTSIVSKIHQIDIAHNPIDSNSFAFWVCVTKVVICSIIYAFMKPKGENNEKISLKIPVMIIIILASVCSNVSYLFQLMGAKDVPATVLYPLVTGGSIILTTLCGAIFLKEKPDKRQIIGIIICFIGTCLFV